jgi:hypothetical protein
VKSIIPGDSITSLSFSMKAHARGEFARDDFLAPAWFPE